MTAPRNEFVLRIQEADGGVCHLFANCDTQLADFSHCHLTIKNEQD